MLPRFTVAMPMLAMLTFAMPTVAMVSAIGCTDSRVGDAASSVGVDLTVADGLTLAEVASGFVGPTQVTHLPDGRLLLAELNGAEGAGTGRVVAIADDGATDVLFDDLLVPTGVAVTGDEIWVMEQRTLSRGPIGGGQLTPVLTALPFNGRSETTLTVTPEGTIVYGTSGALQSGRQAPVEGSGVLWELDPSDAEPEPRVLATGFKNAYGHTIDGGGRLWATEVSDGRFDGERAPDEVVEVIVGVDHGWPRCIGDRRPVAEADATEAECASGPPSLALFDPGATPTSVVVAPWDPDTLLVALWLEQRVVAVPTANDGRPHRPVDVVTGDFRPLHLLIDDDRVLIVDHDAGRILALAVA